MSTLSLQPIDFVEAAEFIRRHHRHHLPPVGWRFGIGLNDGAAVVGVVTVGRPVARARDDGWTAEVTRCCVQEGIPNGCSMLYAAAWRARRAMGGRRIGTYLRASEPGISVRAAGWRLIHQTRERSDGWDTPSRPRVTKHTEAKTLWEMPA